MWRVDLGSQTACRLTVFRTGLAHYEGVQEGLGVFAEWAVGGLSPARMRLLFAWRLPAELDAASKQSAEEFEAALAAGRSGEAMGVGWSHA